MKNQEKKYYYPTRDSEHPDKVRLEEVTGEFGHELAKEIDRIRKKKQYDSECVVTKDMIWACDGVCFACPFHRLPETSLDEPLQGTDDLTLGDMVASAAPTPESIMEDRELLDALYAELAALDPEGLQICKLIMQKKSEREIAKLMDIPRSTLKRHWAKYQEALADKLHLYYYGE